MLTVKPTRVRFNNSNNGYIKLDPTFKTALVNYANKKELGNVSAVIKKAVIKYIRYKPSTA